MIEKDITIDSNGNRLSGTVCLPEGKGRFPLVLMVHGSGRLDRNENAKGYPLNVFNTIAHYLAHRGIASLRYDKRGCGKSTGDFYATGHFDLVDDAVNWFDTVTQHDFCESDQIFVLGHSEGCIIAPQVSAKRPTVAGLILLCPFIDKMESIAIKQAMHTQRELEGMPGVNGLFRRSLYRMTAGMPVTSQKMLMDKLKSSNAATMRIWFQKIPAKWLRELFRLDPATIFSQITCPMLLIGGEKDLQCDPADISRIADLAKGPVDAHVVQNLTHLLRFDEEPPSFTYKKILIAKPMESIVLELIAAWFNEQCSRQ